MKFKSYILLAFLAFFVGSCKESILDINTNPNALPTASPNFVLTNALVRTAANFVGPNSTGSYWSGQWTQSNSCLSLISGHRGLALVGPVELVEDPVAVLEVQVDAFGFNFEASLAAFAALPDETGVEIDRDEMLLTCHRILEGVATGAADAGDVKPAVDPVVFDIDGRAHDAGDLEGGAEDRPGKATELTGEDLG